MNNGEFLNLLIYKYILIKDSTLHTFIALIYYSTVVQCTEKRIWAVRITLELGQLCDFYHLTADI